MAIKTKKNLNKQRKTMKKLRKQKKQRGGQGEGEGDEKKGILSNISGLFNRGKETIQNAIAPPQSGGSGAADHAIKVYGDIGGQTRVSASDNTILTKDPSAMKLAVQAGGAKRKNQKEMYEEMEKLFKQKQGNKVLKNLRQLVKQKGGKKVLGKFLNEN